VEPVYWNIEFLEFLGPGISVIQPEQSESGIENPHDSAYATSIVSILGHRYMTPLGEVTVSAALTASINAPAIARVVSKVLNISECG
jgi:hypothetical protein